MSFSPRSAERSPHRPAAGRKRRRRIPLSMKLLALIGAAAVIIFLGRTLIVPLLVYLNTLGGGA